MKITYNKKINDENIDISQKHSHKATRRHSPRREILGDVTDETRQKSKQQRRNQLKKLRFEQRYENETDFETEIEYVKLPEEIDTSNDVIKHHFDKVEISSDIPSELNEEDAAQLDENFDVISGVTTLSQDIRHQQQPEKVDENNDGDDDEDNREHYYQQQQQQLQQQKREKEHNIPDMHNHPPAQRRDKSDQVNHIDKTEDDIKPMEPIWNREIFNELQYVMRKFSRTTLDENDEDTHDVTMVAEYAPEIFNYMHELEHRLAPDPIYMNNQDELKWEMRAVLIDWIVQVHSRFNLLPETLYLTVNYIDRFLSKRKVSLSRFQLVGAVAIFIAAKYEEINCPTVQEVAYMADNAYSIEDFLKAERFMIDVLEFDMGWPGPMSFLRRTSKADDYDYETRTLAKYFLEITIMDARFVASQPSWLAAGAHYLSRRLLNRGEWTEAHVFYSGYTELQLRPLAEILLDSCRNAPTHHKAIFEKYQERRYRRSATFVQEYFQAIDTQ